MSNPINAVFSGGPLNGEVHVLECDFQEVVVAQLDPLPFPEAWGQPDKPVPHKCAIYRRTEWWDDNCNKIFEFCGIHDRLV